MYVYYICIYNPNPDLITCTDDSDVNRQIVIRQMFHTVPSRKHRFSTQAGQRLTAAE